MTRALERMPLYFIENRGQLDSRVAYYVQGRDTTLYFTAEGMTLVQTEQRHEGNDSKYRLEKASLRRSIPQTPDPVSRWVVKLDFVGANPNPKIEAADPTPAVISYFNGPKENWKPGLSTYGSIVYSDLWPGIDLVYSGMANRLKYTFLVKPGADPDQVRLAYRGVKRIRLNDAGQLEVETPAGVLQDDKPYAYQEVEGRRVEINAAYSLDRAPAGGPQGYGFALGSYDRSKPLVLDPAVFVYAGYIGGSGGNVGQGIAVDSSGNAYVTGVTSSTEATFPVTVGPDLTFNGGTWDAFVAKVNAAGTALVYCGYIGGGGTDQGNGIAVDSSGNAYVTGDTDSTEATFPVTGGPDLTYNGVSDAFVAKVNAAGTALVYCGYIGGSGADQGTGIAVDSSGNAYVTGETGSTQATFPVTGGPDLTFSGVQDAFVAKIRTSDATAAAFLPSSARAPGAGGAFYTTDVTVANTGASDTQLTLKFLGNNKDGNGGAERSFTLAAGRSTTYADILGSVFGETSNFGAIRISSSSSSFVVLGQTSTPGFGGTFGQSVPAARPSDQITSGAPRSIVGVREDGAFRTNLILSNATSASLDVDVALFADTGASLGSKRYTLAPLGMTQVTRVVRDVGFSADVQGARVVLSTPTAGGSFAAYASAIDNITNDPRTLLPKGTSAGNWDYARVGTGGTNTWFLPSSARAPGAGGAFYTTDLMVSNTGPTDTTFALKFLGHDQDGTGGSEQTFALAAGKTVTYADVLGSVFSVSSGFGAIRIASPSAALNSLGQTSTPGFGGTFGQSVPASALEDLIVSGSPRSLVAVREDPAFRTNVILCNTTPASLDVDAVLIAAGGPTLASKRYTLPPLGMTQVTRVVRDMGVSGDVTGARLVLSTPTPAGAFAAYASAIDNTTNDPRTLLPK